MRKTLTAIAIVGLSVLGGVMPANATTANPTLHSSSSAANKPSYWGTDCKKIEFRDGVSKYYLSKSYSTVVVKAGTTNTVYKPFSGPGYVKSLTGKNISHIIYCGPGYKPPYPGY